MAKKPDQHHQHQQHINEQGWCSWLANQIKSGYCDTLFFFFLRHVSNKQHILSYQRRKHTTHIYKIITNLFIGVTKGVQILKQYRELKVLCDKGRKKTDSQIQTLKFRDTTPISGGFSITQTRMHQQYFR